MNGFGVVVEMPLYINTPWEKNFEPSPLPKLESDYAASTGTTPKLAPG